MYACVVFSRVLAHPQMLKCQEATRVQGHQHVTSFHDVQSEGTGTDDNPLRLCSQRQHHPVLILGQEGQAETERRRECQDVKKQFRELVTCDTIQIH